jgi:ferrous iron transport protein A
VSPPDDSSATGDVVPLGTLDVGSAARVVGIRGGRASIRRCTALGLRVGAELTVSQRRGSGVVVISGNTRIALGAEMTRLVDVEPLPAEAAS